MRALTRKALADVTRRKGRTLLAILGILIGVLGLTAVNEAADVIGGVFFYSTDAQAVPNITFTVDRLPAAVATTIQHLPNVEIFQLRTTYTTLWLIAQILSGAHLQITPRVSNFHYTSFDADAQLGIVGLLTIMRLLAGLSLLLSCVMIFNTVTTLLTEQLKIIGTMKALGGTGRRITGSYLLTVSIYVVIGTALGLGLGLAAGYQLASRLAATVQIQVGALSFPVDVRPFQVTPWVLITSVLVGLLAPALSALWPLWTGTRITVREAIATYGVRPGAGKRPHAWGRQFRWVPQTAWLGLVHLKLVQVQARSAVDGLVYPICHSPNTTGSENPCICSNSLTIIRE